MIAKILGLIDLIVACLVFFDAPHNKFFIIMLCFLICKGLLFGLTGDLGSWFDVASVVIIVVSWGINIPGVALIVVAIYLGVKGAASLLA